MSLVMQVFGSSDSVVTPAKLASLLEAEGWMIWFYDSSVIFDTRKAYRWEKERFPENKSDKNPESVAVGGLQSDDPNRVFVRDSLSNADAASRSEMRSIEHGYADLTVYTRWPLYEEEEEELMEAYGNEALELARVSTHRFEVSISGSTRYPNQEEFRRQLLAALVESSQAILVEDEVDGVSIPKSPQRG